MPTERPRVVSYEEAIRSEDQLLRLKAHTLGAVAAVVPASVAGFGGVTRRRRLGDVVGLEASGSGSSVLGVWERLLEDPFWPEGADSGATVVGLDERGGRAGSFRGYLRSLELSDLATMYLRSAGAVVAVIALARSVEQGRFSKDEGVGLRRLQPLIERAYLCAVEPRVDSARERLLGAGLSDREADIAELVGRGATNAEIARSLHVSEATVKTHLTRIYVKVGVGSRTQLALLVGERIVTA